MRKSTIIILFVFFMTLFAGCGGVSESKYQAVISERDSLSAQLKNLQEELSSVKKENNELKSRLQNQQQELANLRDSLETAQAELEKAKAEAKKAAQYYKVKPGDSLWSISNQFGITVDQLRQLNNLKGTAIQTGQQLRVN
jgi:LysM repeat protein